MREVVAAARGVVPFLIGAGLAQADLTTERGRVAALSGALAVLGLEPDPELRREWARSEVARPLGMAYDLVVASAARQGIALDAVEGVADTRRGTGSRGRISVDARDIPAADVRLERALLRAVLQAPDVLPAATVELTEEHLRHPSAAAVWRAILAAGGPGAATEAVLAAAEDDTVRDVIRGLLLEEDPSVSVVEPELRRKAATELVHRVLARSLADEERVLRDRLSTVDAAGEPQEMLRIQTALQVLRNRRQRLTEVLSD
jgi:DNA primase